MFYYFLLNSIRNLKKWETFTSCEWNFLDLHLTFIDIVYKNRICTQNFTTFITLHSSGENSAHVSLWKINLTKLFLRNATTGCQNTKCRSLQPIINSEPPHETTLKLVLEAPCNRKIRGTLLEILSKIEWKY